MGSSLSVVCASHRSTHITHSLRPLPPIPENDNEDFEITARSGKLHAADSRDSGIGENDVPYGFLLQIGSEKEIKESTGSPKRWSNETHYDDSESDSSRPSRPHSCRLGNRAASQNGSRRKTSDDFQEDRILNCVRSARKKPSSALSSSAIDERDENIPNSENSSDNEALSIGSNKSQKSSTNTRRKGVKRRLRSATKSGRSSRQSTLTISDADSSSEEVSDQDFLSIPDETSTFSRNKTDTSRRRGWVGGETQTRPISPKSPESNSYYRFVSDRACLYDPSIAKKASERSISSIFLMSVDNVSSPTNMECCDSPNQIIMCHEQRRLDDLALAVTEALRIHQSKCRLSQSDYEKIMRELRQELVSFVFHDVTTDSTTTPRLHVQADESSGVSNASWQVKIQLNDSDEEILQTSEKELAIRLAEKGDHVTGDDVYFLLADHLRTIQQLQQVRDSDTTSLSNIPRLKIGQTIPQSPQMCKSEDLTTQRSFKGSEINPNGISEPDSPTKVSESDIFGKFDVSSTVGVNSQLPPKPPPRKKSDTLTTESDTFGESRKMAKTDNKNGSRRSLAESGFDESDDSEMFASSSEGEDDTLMMKTLMHTVRTMSDNLGAEEISRGLAKLREEQANYLREHGLKEGRQLQSCMKEVAGHDTKFVEEISVKLKHNGISAQELEALLREHMKKTILIRVQPSRRRAAPSLQLRPSSLNDVDEGNETKNNNVRLTNSAPYELSSAEESMDAELKPSPARRRAPTAGLRGGRRPGSTQLHGMAQMEPLRERTEDTLPKVEEIDGRLSVKSRPDSGIVVSSSSCSYSSSEAPKEPDDLDESCITASSELIDKVKRVKPEQHNDLRNLVTAITRGITSEQLKVYAIYCWLTNQNLSRYSRSMKKSTSPSGKLRQLVEKKISHAAFFMELLRAASLKCEKVEGYVKSKDYLPGNTVQCQKYHHTWNVVYIDGHYRLVDPYYGSLKDKFFEDHHFMPSPDEFVLSHFPKDKRWLLMNQAIPIEDFEGTVKTWPAMFHFNIRPLNMKSVIRTYDGKLSITVLLQNVAVIPQLEYAGPGTDLDPDSLVDNIDEEIRDVDNAETFHLTLPQEGNYYFTLLAHVLEDELDVQVFQYRIEYKDELL